MCSPDSSIIHRLPARDSPHESLQFQTLEKRNLRAFLRHRKEASPLHSSVDYLPEAAETRLR
ncbi:hypothetical protein EYF80_014892 [Liparis tanakae]|uniref:Uncharacterized protein n=1 Tax=Liparis tanakae TaxID=230148 RepID=A0A4Z2IBK3_9TELE|nr:hypothetical protein EYF80_014892 [Liparis tanakae]